MIASPAPPPSRPPPRLSYAFPATSRGMSPPACMRWTEGRQAWAPRRMRRMESPAEAFPRGPRLDIRPARGGAFCLLPTACRASLLSAALHPQALGGVCVETPHAFKPREVRRPAPRLKRPQRLDHAAEMQNTDTAPPSLIHRRTKSQLMSPSGSARREALFKLRHSRGGNKRRGTLCRNNIPEITIRLYKTSA